MRLIVCLTLVLFALAFMGQYAAADVPAASPAGVSAASADVLPVLIGQTSSNSSSSGGSTRIPRGVIRLAIFGVIALFGAGAWVVRQMTGSA